MSNTLVIAAKKGLSRRLKEFQAEKGYISPRPVNIFQRHKTGVSVIKGEDGQRLMFIVTSNSYKDRENETITTLALKQYVESAWVTEGKCIPDNEFLLWHDGPPIGDIIWTNMEGPFLTEVARERKDTWSKAVWDYIEAHPEVKWGASHGFEYPPEAKADGVYHHIRKFETSVLPLSAAANPYTFSGVIPNMNGRQKLLDDILKMPGAAAALQKGLGQVRRDLEAEGIQHKARKPNPVKKTEKAKDDPSKAEKTALKGMVEDVRAAVEQIAGMFTDNPDPASIDEAAQLIISALTTSAMMDTPAAEVEADDPAFLEDELYEERQLSEKSSDKLLNRLISTQEALAGSMTTIAESMKALAPLARKLETVERQVKAVSQQLAGRPRRASRALETELEDDSLISRMLQNEKAKSKAKQPSGNFLSDLYQDDEEDEE